MKPLQNNGLIVEESKKEQLVAIQIEDSQDAPDPVIEEHGEGNAATDWVDVRKHPTELDEPILEELPVSAQEHSQQTYEEESKDRQPFSKDLVSLS